LKHPDSKMSKSSDDINGTIYFDDDKDTIMKKFKSSVTDSDDSIQYNLSEKKGISNLIDIYASINEMSHKEVEKTFTDSRYGEFKMAVGECVAEYLNPINLKFTELEKENISEVVEINLQEAQASAELTIQEVNNILGL
jgi:tryptophanyl-tRNA synthetase